MQPIHTFKHRSEFLGNHASITDVSLLGICILRIVQSMLGCTSMSVALFVTAAQDCYSVDTH